MAYEVLGFLTSEIETLRSAVFRAGVLNAKTLGPCAEAHLETILGLVVVSPEIEEATYQALSRIARFARALYAQAQIAEIEEARRVALAAIDALGITVEGAVQVALKMTIGGNANPASSRDRAPGVIAQAALPH